MGNKTGISIATIEQWREFGEVLDKDGIPLQNAYVEFLKPKPTLVLAQRLLPIMKHYYENIGVYETNESCATVLEDVLRNIIGPNLPG